MKRLVLCLTASTLFASFGCSPASRSSGGNGGDNGSGGQGSSNGGDNGSGGSSSSGGVSGSGGESSSGGNQGNGGATDSGGSQGNGGSSSAGGSSGNGEVGSREHHTAAANLSAEETAIEQRAFARLQKSLPALTAEYRSKFGNEISTDNAREVVSPEYAASKEGRTRWSAATHPSIAYYQTLCALQIRRPYPYWAFEWALIR